MYTQKGPSWPVGSKPEPSCCEATLLIKVYTVCIHMYKKDIYIERERRKILDNYSSLFFAYFWILGDCSMHVHFYFSFEIKLNTPILHIFRHTVYWVTTSTINARERCKGHSLLWQLYSRIMLFVGGLMCHIYQRQAFSTLLVFFTSVQDFAALRLLS